MTVSNGIAVRLVRRGPVPAPANDAVLTGLTDSAGVEVATGRSTGVF